MGERKRTRAGHDGLGRELRRLRGGRSLDQISSLSRTPPLADRVKPVASPTLSLIENGISMPTLDTLYTLSVIYRTPMQRLYDIVGLERMVSQTELPETYEEVKAARRAAWQEERWHDALALSVRTEAMASTTIEALLARASRALCLAKVGMASEGVQTLLECLEATELPTSKRYPLYHDLSIVHLAAGQPRAAILASREAIRCAPADVGTQREAQLTFGLVSALLTAADHGFPGHERDVSEALHLIRRGLESDQSDRQVHLYWRFFEAIGRRFEGNHLLAGKLLSSVGRDASDLEMHEVALRSWQHLGAMRRRNGQVEEAETALARAEELGDTLKNPQLIFEVALELLLLARARGDETAARRFVRRCERQFPFVANRTPSVIIFEQMSAGERG